MTKFLGNSPQCAPKQPIHIKYKMNTLRKSISLVLYRIEQLQFSPFHVDTLKRLYYMCCEYFLFFLSKLYSPKYFIFSRKHIPVWLISGVFSHNSHRLVDYFRCCSVKSLLYLVTLPNHRVQEKRKAFFLAVNWYIQYIPFHVCSLSIAKPTLVSENNFIIFIYDHFSIKVI